MTRFIVPIFQVEAVDIPAGQVSITGTQMPAYRISKEFVGDGIRFFDLMRVAPTLAERHYAHLKVPELRDDESKPNNGYYHEAISAVVGPIEGELQIDVPDGYLPVTLVTPVEKIVNDREKRLWHPEGLNRIQKALPPDGFQAGFDQDFWPTKTFQEREDAVRSLQDQGFTEEDAKYFAFYFRREGERYSLSKYFTAVTIQVKGTEVESSELRTYYSPLISGSGLGVRAVERMNDLGE